MIPLLAHGGTGGLAVELSLLSLPLIGFGLLWWWNRRLSRLRPTDAEPTRAASDAESTETEPTERNEPGSDGPASVS